VNRTPRPPPFDGIATGYDASFTDRRSGRWLREAVWEQMEGVFQPDDHVLDLGCGTGEDALHLARQGIHVTATDHSPAMLEVARRKAGAAGMTHRIDTHQLDLATPEDAPWSPGSFSGAFSNFGALNCLPDRSSLARALGGWVRPGGHVVLVVMGPWCPWEVGWHLMHGEPRTAVRRFRPGQEAHVGADRTVRVWYPTPRRLRDEFRPWFVHLGTVGIGVLLPPTQVSHLVDRWPRAFARVRNLERRVASRFPFTWLGDHYLAHFRRR
jgi:SAM-dependent methyltransferase